MLGDYVFRGTGGIVFGVRHVVAFLSMSKKKPSMNGLSGSREHLSKEKKHNDEIKRLYRSEVVRLTSTK